MSYKYNYDYEVLQIAALYNQITKCHFFFKIPQEIYVGEQWTCACKSSLKLIKGEQFE